jgi:hypothetical protein
MVAKSEETVTKPQRRAFDSPCLPITQSLWLEWNARVFRNQKRMPNVLADAIAELWCKARVIVRSELLGE